MKERKTVNGEDACIHSPCILSGSCYILFGEYVHQANNAFTPSATYPGVAFFLQNLFILVSSIIYKFGRTEDMWG